jgi:hypothetical protein
MITFCFSCLFATTSATPARSFKRCVVLAIITARMSACDDAIDGMMGR